MIGENAWIMTWLRAKQRRKDGLPPLKEDAHKNTHRCESCHKIAGNDVEAGKLTEKPSNTEHVNPKIDVTEA